MRRLAFFFLALAACGNRAEPPASTPHEAPSAAPTESPPAKDPEPAPAARRKPFELKNGCADVVTVVLGEDANGKGRTLAPYSSEEIPRNPEGHDTVWLLVPNGTPVKVYVTRGMKRVEVGRSCKTLDAR